jgi:hypothetical protein
MYVPMVVDQFPKWATCIPLADQRADTLALAFYEQFVVIFGFPLFIQTDQGRNYLFSRTVRPAGQVKTRTTHYQPTSSGQVERYNSMVLQFVRCFLSGRQIGWNEHIASLRMTIRLLSEQVDVRLTFF